MKRPANPFTIHVIEANYVVKHIAAPRPLLWVRARPYMAQGLTRAMNTYQHFASLLTQLLGNDTAIRLTVEGYMSLSVEAIGQSAEGNRLISISHYGEQNGDLTRDPEMVFEIHTDASADMAEPISFRNDYMGTMREVYRYDDSGKKTHVNARLKQELKSFARTWFKNLKEQGFLGDTAIGERLT